jgi:endonuclease/exonuclease/phosphatase family metal-dependent hydrolase
MAPRALLGLAVIAAVAPGCAPLNYTHPVEPYDVICCVEPAAAPETLEVVTFNLRFAVQVDEAIALLRDTPALAGADILLLQEMDGRATRMVARALGMNAVYYPSVRHPMSRRDFGNAILSRHRMLRHRKLLLPHPGRFGRTQRIAASAMIAIGGRTVAVTSTHLATPVENGPQQRREQIDAVAAMAGRFRADLVLVGGDLNDPKLAGRMIEHGYACPTRGHGSTSASGLALDQVFVRRPGIDPSVDASHPAGVVKVDRRISDHDAVWVRVPLDPPPAR